MPHVSQGKLIYRLFPRERNAETVAENSLYFLGFSIYSVGI